jgi:hypothetical protein
VAGNFELKNQQRQTKTRKIPSLSFAFFASLFLSRKYIEVFGRLKLFGSSVYYRSQCLLRSFVPFFTMAGSPKFRVDVIFHSLRELEQGKKTVPKLYHN